MARRAVTAQPLWRTKRQLRDCMTRLRGPQRGETRRQEECPVRCSEFVHRQLELKPRRRGIRDLVRTRWPTGMYRGWCEHGWLR